VRQTKQFLLLTKSKGRKAARKLEENDDEEPKRVYFEDELSQDSVTPNKPLCPSSSDSQNYKKETRPKIIEW
jgi:hypothetical protein